MNTLQVSQRVNLPIRDQVQMLVGATKLRTIRLDEIHAGPVNRAGNEMHAEVTRRQTEYKYSEQEDRVMARFDHEIRVDSEESLDQATTIRIIHLAAVDVTEPVVVEKEALEAFIDSTLYFMVYPYFREKLASVTTELGMPALTADYLTLDDIQPESAPD